MMKKFKGNVTISRIPSRLTGGIIEIALRDNISHKIIANADIEYADFAQALTGGAYMPCVFNIYNVRETEDYCDN